MRLINVPWDQALDIILRTKGLGMQQQGNVMLIAPLDEIASRAKAEGEAQKKLQDIQRKQGEVQTFSTNTQRSLQQRNKIQQGLLLEEITKVAADLAKRKGATVVVDKSGPSLLGTPVVVYFDPAYDITEEVITEINKDRPAAPAAAATSAPATVTPPTFAVPNVGTKPEPKKQ